MLDFSEYLHFKVHYASLAKLCHVLQWSYQMPFSDALSEPCFCAGQLSMLMK